MFIHPEVSQMYLLNLASIARQGKMPYKCAQDQAFTQTWNECLAATNELLSSIAQCPGLVVPEAEPWMDDETFESSMDAVLEEFEEEI